MRPRFRDYVRVALTDPFCLVLLSLFGIAVAAGASLFVFGKNVAWLVGTPGTVLVILGALVYVAWRDPEGRFPNESFGTRLDKVLTFNSGDKKEGNHESDSKP